MHPVVVSENARPIPLSLAAARASGKCGYTGDPRGRAALIEACRAAGVEASHGADCVRWGLPVPPRRRSTCSAIDLRRALRVIDGAIDNYIDRARTDLPHEHDSSRKVTGTEVC